MAADCFALDGHKLFWHLDRVAAWQKDRLVPPIYVEISPLSYCNHQCIFCGLDFIRGERVILETEVLLRRIEEMAALGVKSVMFAGEGEPLLHPDLPLIAARAKEAGIDVSVTTNGMSGTTELWEKLLPSLTWIRFSIDAATSETYQVVHGVKPGAFQRTIASLKEAMLAKQRQKLPVTVGVQFLMIRQNLQDIEPALSLYSGIGVDYLSFKPYSEHPQMLNKSGFTYTREMIDDIALKIERFGTSGPTRIIFRKAATDAYAESAQKFSHCRALPFWGYISSRGDFYSCSVYINDERFSVGNIYQTRMSEILFGDKRGESIDFAEKELEIDHECRVNCRMARINEFLEFLDDKPEHINFI
ncbi:radical SAM protein [Citrifermentans bremense]|uniref:radical SAM protein n=1 Tax=Citrifermentans bremense TaxID=60035 RepID=UPI000420C89F|nr:radical SAM/SPASM domain-containing protein [Citrifermentans bremense]